MHVARCNQCVIVIPKCYGVLILVIPGHDKSEFRCRGTIPLQHNSWKCWFPSCNPDRTWFHLAHVDNFMSRSFQVISTPPLHLGYARMAQVKFRPSKRKRASWVLEILGSATDFLWKPFKTVADLQPYVLIFDTVTWISWIEIDKEFRPLRTTKLKIRKCPKPPKKKPWLLLSPCNFILKIQPKKLRMEAPDVGTMPAQTKHWTSAWLWEGRVTRDFRPNLFQSMGYIPHHCTLDFFSCYGFGQFDQEYTTYWIISQIVAALTICHTPMWCTEIISNLYSYSTFLGQTCHFSFMQDNGVQFSGTRSFSHKSPNTQGQWIKHSNPKLAKNPTLK